ncbi:MAG TPA: glycosyl hydrolase family 28-related protein [Armatimonadota bacterium]|jgi:hypothetical protein
MKTLLATLIAGLLVTALQAADPMIPSLNWIPRSDWVSVKPAAVGDGVADDTAAIQAALDTLKDGSTVYLPAGTYRITQSLTLNGPRHGILVVGNGADTRLVWDGPVGGWMFAEDGVAYCRYVGMVFDGRGKAAVGFCHTNHKRFETEVRHQYLAFLNFTDAGILADPQSTIATAETQFENCVFDGCRRGIAFTQFNDYDYTFDGCEFRRGETGIVCQSGNFYVRNCHFEANTSEDIKSSPEHGCSVRRSTSVGSKAFLRHANGVAPIIVEDCRVEGWTDPTGAISVAGAPALIFDCVFTNPPNATPPILLQGGYPGGERVLVSGNVSEQTGGEAVQPGAGGKVYVIPAGKRKGTLTSAGQHFLNETVAVPSFVFDAKVDFGAKGDGATDDTAALQRTIDAARARGKGALAYFPGGTYAVSGTLRVTGADYSVGGSGMRTGLLWKGAADGIIMTVEDPQRITIENLNVGGHDIGQMNDSIDILQTSSGAPSSVTYDGVAVWGYYQKQAFRRGLWFKGLGPGSTVVMPHVQGNLHFIDSARATIISPCSYEGAIVVEGKAKGPRDGLLGFLTRLETANVYSLYIGNNQNFVASDFYIEQADHGLFLQGDSDDPPGRVTMQGPKFHFSKLKDGSDNIPLNLKGFSGSLFFGPEQFYVEPLAEKLLQEGARPVDIFLLGCSFYNTGLVPQLQPTAHLYTIGNQRVPQDAAAYQAPDAMEENTLARLSEGLDDLRRLGETDLRLMHPQVLAKPVAAPK